MFPRSSLRAQAIATAVFVAVAMGLMMYARAFRGTAERALAAEPIEPDGPPRPPGFVLTVKSAATARELQAALLQTFGNNARAMSCVTFVDYDAHPDRLHIAFALDDADATRAAAKDGALRRMRDLLEAVGDGEMRWSWVLVTGTARVPDRFDAVSESTVVRAQFSRERLRQVDWSRFTGDDVPALAAQFWTSADFGRDGAPLTPELPPATQPRPVTPPEETTSTDPALPLDGQQTPPANPSDPRAPPLPADR